MGFLQNIFGKGGRAADEVSEMPTRTRTFSASAFRDAEVARENEAYHRREQAQLDASAVLSPAVAPVAEVLMAKQQPDPFATFDQAPSVDEAEAWSEPTDFDQADAFGQATDELAPPPFEPLPPAPALAEEGAMHWEDAVGWLSQRSAESRNFVAQYWNWEHDLRVVEFLIQQPDLDPGVAAGILWLTAANEDIFPWGDDEPHGEFDQAVAKITHMVGHRFDAGDFPPMAHGFDDSWDCERLKERLVELHGEGRINWNPRDLPTTSVAQMMSFDDLPAQEREEVIAFLARHGVH